MKATGLTSAVPRRIFVPLNQDVCPNIESKCFRARFVTRPWTRLGNEFEANLDTLNSKTFSDKAPNYGEGSSVPLKCIVATYTRMSKRTLCTTLLTLEKYVVICSCIYDFLFFLFTISNGHIQKCFFSK